jgi:rhodanese-related sulfurtransferase
MHETHGLAKSLYLVNTHIILLPSNEGESMQIYKKRIDSKNFQAILILLVLIIGMNASMRYVKAENHSVTKDWVKSNLRNANVVFLDARSFNEYRSGHLPKAVNIEWTYSYDYNGSYKLQDELRKIFETAGVTPQKTIVTYCQAGRRAEAIYNTLCMLDYSQVFVYEGSWAEWSTDPQAPIETKCTLALVGGEKNNTNTEGCSSCSSPISRTYTFISELTGINRLSALALALSNSNITRLMAHFILKGFIPSLREANATKVMYENSNGVFDQRTQVVIPCKPNGPENENVTYAEIYFVSEPTISGAASEKIIEGKTWLSAYWVNKTTSQVESITVDPCDYWCLLYCAFQHPEVWSYCIGFCYCAFAWPPCVLPCVICIIGLGAVSALCTIPCGCWTPPTVNIKIEAWPTTDTYTRSHGMAIDQPLPNDWWLQSGYEFKVTGSAFTYERSVTINTPGTHYVEYAASGYVPNYAWHAKISINGVLKAEGDVGRFNHLRVYFDV